MTHLKFGIISNLDIPNGLAKVYFEEDGFESAWIKISVMRSAPDQVSFPFDIKEHVWCIMDEHCEYGVIGGAVYDEQNTPSGSAAGKLLITFGDSSAIEYNRETSILKFDIKGKITINCDEADLTCTGEAKINAEQVTITAPETKIDGILSVTGAATIAGIASVGGLAGIAGAPVDGTGTELNVKSVTASDDVTSGTISLQHHTHISGGSGSPTSEPTP